MSNNYKQNTYQPRQENVKEVQEENKTVEEVKPQVVEETVKVESEAKPVESNTVQVRALDTYQKNLITDKELGRIPQKGEIFTVSKERFEILSGKNEHKIVFVEKI